MGPIGVIAIGVGCLILGLVGGYIAGTLLANPPIGELKSAQERGKALERRCLDLEKQRDDLMAETTAQHDLISQVKEAATKDQAARTDAQTLTLEAQAEVKRLLAKYEKPKRSHHLSKKDGGVG
jgi:hypothetical protein